MHCDSFLNFRKGATLALRFWPKSGHPIKVVHAQGRSRIPFYLISQKPQKRVPDLRRPLGPVLRISGARWPFRLLYATFLDRFCRFCGPENRVRKQHFSAPCRCPTFGQPNSGSMPLDAIGQNRVIPRTHFLAQNPLLIPVYCKNYFHVFRINLQKGQ